MVDDIQQTLDKIESTLVALDPNEIDGDDTGLQERKSANTRMCILNAAVHCLAKYGYAKTSTQFVAQTAKVSRGAMLHHYPNKMALIAAVIDHVEIQRLRQFHEKVRKLTEAQRIVEGQGLEIYWQIMNTPESDALLELTLACRTDAQLRKIFDKKIARYEKLRTELLPAAFPEWATTSRENLLLARDLTTVTLTGLSLNHRILGEKKRRVALRQFIYECVLRLRESESK